MGVKAFTFGQGLLDSPPAGIECRAIDGTKRRGLFATRSFESGQVICSDQPLAAFQLASSLQRVQACALCFRYLGSLQSQLAHLSGGQEVPTELPGASDSSVCHLSSITPCRHRCGELFCSPACEEEAWEDHHRLLCDGSAMGGAASRGHPYSEFKAQAASENEAFVMAAKIIACIAGMDGACARQRTGGAFQRFCASAPWWELVAIPDDVPEAKHVAYRRKLRANAERSLGLLTTTLSRNGAAVPPDVSLLLTLDFYGQLLGAIIQNSICIELQNPARQYLEAVASSGDAKGVEALIPLCQAVVQHQAVLSQREEEDNSMSLSDNSEDEESEDEDGSGSGFSGCDDSEEEAGISGAGVGSGEGLPAEEMLTAAMELVPDLEASGMFPIIGFLNHSCEPSVSIEFTEAHGRKAELVATRDIQEGEELSISYIDDDLLGLEERQQELAEYVFVCRCPRCVAEGRKRHKGAVAGQSSADDELPGKKRARVG